MSAKFQELSNMYREAFGTAPPVHDLGMWPTPSEAEDMLQKSLERGTPITDEDFPDLPEGIVV